MGLMLRKYVIINSFLSNVRSFKGYRHIKYKRSINLKVAEILLGSNQVNGNVKSFAPRMSCWEQAL